MKLSLLTSAAAAALLPLAVSAARIDPRATSSSSSSSSSASSSSAASSSKSSSSATSSSSSSSSAAAASSSTSATNSSTGSFPTDIGYLGTYSYATTQPFLVETDNLNGTHYNSPYEYRYTALDASSDEFDLYKHWGNLSPYFSSPQFTNQTSQYSKLNDTCYVEAVSVFHRHGSRYPASGEAAAPFAGGTLTNYTLAKNFTATGPLAFLEDYEYQLGSQLLVPIGAQQLFDSGVFHYMSYGKLLNVSLDHKPVIRTPSQSRMLNSSRYWTLGFFGWDAPTKINLEVIIEADDFNSTLSPYDVCPGSDNITIAEDYLLPVWEPIYLKDAVSRLQNYTSIPLDTDLVYGMQTLCPYEVNGLGYSNFCNLFTKEEWQGFEYSLDLGFQGDYGFMSPSGKAQGVGYAQELLARLVNQTFSGPITSQNNTLDNSSTYFPIDQPMYVDFTHDDVIVSVLTALNYSQFNSYLSSSEITPNRNFVLSHIAPFAARLVFETIHCTEGNSTTRYLRTKLNEGIVPMGPDQGCSPARADGLCPLEDFVNYQNANAVKDANFNLACFGINGTDYTITGPSVYNGTIGYPGQQ